MTDEDRVALLQLARDAITAWVLGRDAPPPAPALVMERCAGVFVSLHKERDLRGCIGHIEQDQAIAPLVARCAVAAATSDPRFPPVTPSELAALQIEVSILGPLERIAGAADVEIGRHGLVVEQGWSRGLLLPQVAVEWQWDSEDFLCQTCVKAGLPRDAWKNEAALWRFEAEVFGEGPEASPGFLRRTDQP
jgi:AmmeMemoRadiSam system protein A